MISIGIPADELFLWSHENDGRLVEPLLIATRPANIAKITLWMASFVKASK